MLFPLQLFKALSFVSFSLRKQRAVVRGSNTQVSGRGPWRSSPTAAGAEDGTQWSQLSGWGRQTLGSVTILTTEFSPPTWCGLESKLYFSKASSVKRNTLSIFEFYFCIVLPAVIILKLFEMILSVILFFIVILSHVGWECLQESKYSIK